MGRKPGPEYSLERKKVNEGYSPENCIWATPEEQARNKRSNRMLTAFGKTQYLAAWAKEYNISHSAILKQLSNEVPLEYYLAKVKRND